MTITSAPAEETAGTSPVRPSPREDFYRHVNWEWLQSTPIPDSEAVWGTFPILGDRTLRRLRDIAEEVQQATDAVSGSIVQIVRDYYVSGVDMAKRDEAGLAPLQSLLDRIAAIQNRSDVARVIAVLQMAGLSPFFSIEVGEDFKRPGWNAFSIGQGGLGLPDRDYYLAEDKAEIRERYRAFSRRLFEMSELDEEAASRAADAAWRIEMTLAEASHPMEQVRQLDKNYHAYSVERAKAQLPAMDWDAYLTDLGVSQLTRMVVGQPDVLKRVAELLEETDLADIRAYLTLVLLRSYANTLGQGFVDEAFDFYGRTLAGLQEQKPLWKTILTRQYWGILSNAFGPLYAERYFSPSDKHRVVRMVGYVVDAFADRVKNLEWMNERTKRLTLEKLEKITFKMGYPDEWIDLSDLEIGSIFATNVLNVERFEMRHRLGQVTKRVNRAEWFMPPTLVNAMSNLRQEMTFPMAILQPPFFDSTADEASNYGAIGAVIGHELTHFFDDQGSKFNVDGAMKTWWDDEDRRAFAANTGGFVGHYGRFVIDGIPLNPRLTLGENIADVGGLSIAYDALQRFLDESGEQSDDDLTPAQKLFIAWAQVWREKYRHEALMQKSLIDPHSPGEVRTNGTVSAIPQFFEAFGVEEGDSMWVVPEKRPVLW